MPQECKPVSRLPYTRSHSLGLPSVSRSQSRFFDKPITSKEERNMFDRFCTRRKWFLAIVAGALGTFTAGQAAYGQGTWTTLANVSPSATEGMTVGGIGQVIERPYGFSPLPIPGNPTQTPPH